MRASPCNYPKRLVGGYTVDLQPLISWWSEPKGTRPLSGWKHVTGTMVRDGALGWVIEGRAEGHGQFSTFFLKNPPRERLRRFQQLKRELPEYERALATAQDFVSRPICTDWYESLFATWQAPPISASEHREASAILGDLKKTVSRMREEMHAMQDEQGNFKVDAFALRVNEWQQGLPVFDHGSIEQFRYSGTQVSSR